MNRVLRRLYYIGFIATAYGFKKSKGGGDLHSTVRDQLSNPGIGTEP